MATATERPPTSGVTHTSATLLSAPWRASAWIDTAQVVAGFPIAVVACTVIASLAATTLSLAITAVLAVPLLAATFLCGRLFSSWQRARIQGFTGVSIPAPPVRYTGSSWLRRLWSEARDPNTWRQLGYHLLSGLTASIGFTFVVGFWTVGAMLSTIVLHGWALPDDTVLDPLVSPAGLVLLTTLGLVIFFCAPRVAHVAARLDATLATRLLAPSRSEQLARRVASLSESRAEVIEAADAERRRIERDLHDGTQQRLVSLAMNLGLARTTLTEVPESVRETIDQAHEEAKLALTELRDVVRGMHPAVLDDLGLDAALSGIAARSPVPVRLLVELPRRPPRTVEAVAYFVVAEALSNVAKHAQATRVDIVVEATPDGVLTITISDDGRGGADPDRGTGLRGLRQRVGSVDGTLTINSPEGGPTIVVVELPCA
ncbi:sensor histidine kinase [Microbispora sp. NBC_01389]|uniref:sensor histidine kinase n=1 Tax=Microbispora sp. NBC_01389 TaxID=2903584 RepID=UPI003245C63C